MKKFIILSLGLAVSGSIFAQKSAISNAAIYHSENQIANAAREINKAIVNEKTQADPKAWYYRGLIYKSMIGSKEDQVKVISENPEKESLLSFKKAMELDPAGKFNKQSKQEMEGLFTEFINKGYGMYNIANFQQALEYFEGAQTVRPDDTTGYLYASYAAEELGRFDLVTSYIEKLEAIGYKTPQLYLQKIISVQKKDVNAQNALAISEKALKEYPDNKDILAVQTSLLIELHKWDQAISNLNTLHELHPENEEYLRVQASVYDQAGDRENALKCYEKVLKLNPANTIALYSSGAIYYEKAGKLFEELHGISKASFKAKGGDEKEVSMIKFFQEARTRADKAIEISSEEEELNSISHLQTQIDKLLNAYESYKKQLR